MTHSTDSSLTFTSLAGVLRCARRRLSCNLRVIELIIDTVLY